MVPLKPIYKGKKFQVVLVCQLRFIGISVSAKSMEKKLFFFFFFFSTPAAADGLPGIGSGYWLR
jgi:hypothetical protein